MEVKQCKKASYTVEASFLMPLILSVITILIYGCFYLHDRAVLTGLAYEAALLGSRIEESDKDIILQQTKEVGSQIISNKVINTVNIATMVTVTNDHVLVTYTGDFKIPGEALTQLLLKEYAREIKVEGMTKRLHQVRFLRDCRKVEALQENNSKKGEKAQ